MATTAAASPRRARPGNKRAARAYDEAAVRRKIIPARDVEPVRAFLWYARNKVGKTTLLGSASELGRTLIIDCEKGTSSIKSKYPTVDVYKLTEYEEIDEIYWYLANKKHPYKFVGIDPITRLGQHCMTWVLRDKSAKDLASDPFQPTQQDWGKTAELMRSVVTRYKALPDIFLMITAYERRRDSDDEDSDFDFVIGPDAQPALKGYLMGQMDVIGRLYIKQLDQEDEEEDEGLIKVERRLLTAPHEIYEAGDRSGKLPRVLREPTMKKILARINRRTE